MELTRELDEHTEDSPVQRFYANRSVLVTGVTGFLGKILVEKLLRGCPDIKTIYVLIRAKRGKSPEERLDMVLQKECFRLVKEKYPTFQDKMAVIVGDIVEPLCGVNGVDMEKLQRDVSIVFHSAARVNFTDSLRIAVQDNVIGTRNLLELCKLFPKLESFVHVSTAFSRRDPDGTVPEAVGGHYANPYDVLNLLRLLDDSSIEKIIPNIIKDGTTTYQFSKALAELLLEEEKGNIRASIVRPCIVCSTWKEPFPGWCDILQGITGLFIAAGKGFLRAVHVPPFYRILGIPADAVANCCINTAWYSATTSQTRPEDTFVVNCTFKYESFPVGEELLGPILDLRMKYPLSSIYRYPDFKAYRSRFFFKLHIIVDHYIPAVIIDSFLYCFTGKTLMLRLYRKIETLWDIFLKQGSVQWHFRLENYKKIENALSPKDSKVFWMNLEELNWNDYIEGCVVGGRQYLCKEDLSTVPYALMKGRIHWTLTTIMKWCLILFLISYLIPQNVLDMGKTYYPRFLHTIGSDSQASLEHVNHFEM